MDKFDNIYRIESARYKNWDYGSNAFYFVTICTSSREHFFGEIENNKMVLNEVGKIARSIWIEIPLQFSFVRLGEFVIMPNHIHGIIQINKNEKPIDSDIGNDMGVGDTGDGGDVGGKRMGGGDVVGKDMVCRDAINRVSTNHVPAINHANKNETTPNGILKKGGITGSHNPMLHQNLSRILRWYKGRVTFESRKINPNFSWQSRFHDRIIRDKKEWYAKTNYIKNNPKNWRDDELNEHQ